MAPPAASPPPSPSYLHSHATSNTPHNWEQPGCQFHDPEQLYKRWVACRRDSRNGGNTAKNARLHYGVKAAPIIPFGEGIKDFLGTFLPLPPEPGARPEWRLPVRPHGYRLPDWGQESNRGRARVAVRLARVRDRPGEAGAGGGHRDHAPRPGQEAGGDGGVGGLGRREGGGEQAEGS